MQIKSVATLATCLFLTSAVLPAYANDHGDTNGHQLVQDEYKPGTKVTFDEDQDEVYDAVQKGLIKPFSELYDAVDTQLNGRVIKVELEKDDHQWFYELKLMYKNNVIKVKYNATTLGLTELKGHNIIDVIKK